MCKFCENENGESLGDVIRDIDLSIAREKMVRGMVVSLGVSPTAVFDIWVETMRRADWHPMLAYNYENNMVLMGYGRPDDGEGKPGPAVLPIAELPLDMLIMEVSKYQEMRRKYISGEPVEG